MPFLVDTLSMTLTQAGFSPQIMQSIPILRVQRDARGQLQSLDQTSAGATGGAA